MIANKVATQIYGVFVLILDDFYLILPDNLAGLLSDDLKFGHAEKATKIWNNHPLDLTATK